MTEQDLKAMALRLAILGSAWRRAEVAIEKHSREVIEKLDPNSNSLMGACSAYALERDARKALADALFKIASGE